MKKQILIGIAIVLAIILGVVVIKQQQKGTTDPSPSSQTAKVSVRMKWFFAGTMTGWFAGKEQGFFRDKGIDLEITPGGPDNSSIKLVAAGTDKFGVAGADEVLMAREKGIPVVAIGVLFKESPICFIAKKGKGITSPSQWEGKTIEVSYGDNSEIQFRALVKKYGVKNFKEVPYTFNLLPFIQDKVDVSVAYKMDQVVNLKNQGVDVDIITAKEHEINPYGDVVITTEQLLKENPALVRQFMEATVKSFQWSIDHSDQAVSLLIKSASNLKAENESQVWRETIPFLTAEGGASKIGVMSPDRWKETQDVLVEFKALNTPANLEKSYRSVLQE